LKKALKGVYLTLMLIFLYAPIVVMIVYSFNASKTRARWGGFSLRWYEELFRSRQIMDALSTTVSIALFAALVATVVGTLAAIGIHAMKARPAKVLINISYLPMTMPDIVTGVSLMLLFVFSRFPLGYWSMLMAHITFDTPYVLFSVLPKLKQMNVNLYEAALDLGCTPMQAVRKVILPQIMPGVFTGALLAFTMSLDDFVISYFTTATESNLSILVYSMARRGIKPTINALSALMFVVVLVLLLLINRRSKLENV
jgi:spermidine/putrescine transport system permease protein